MRVPRSPVVRTGLALFVIGLICIAVDVLPFFAGDGETPLWLNLACLAAPLGFALLAWSVLHDGRAEQRRAVRDLDAGHDVG